MSEMGRLRPKMVRRAVALGALVFFVAVVVACSPGTPESEGGQSGDLPPSDVPQAAGEFDAPEFDTEVFARINPEPEIRALDYSIDLGFKYVDYEKDRIPRDAIKPVYSPIFVTPDNATLKPQELVIGLSINDDARAYPVGMMRVREIVNDEVGGTPVLVTW